MRTFAYTRLAFVAALCLVATVTLAQSTHVDSTITTIVVKYRDDALPAGATTLDGALVQQISTAMQSRSVVVGRTRDGAFELALDPGLPIDNARAGLNRLRERPEVLYAVLARGQSATAGKDAVKSARLLPPVRALIVKYKDSAVLASFSGSGGLGAGQLAQLSAAAGQPVAFRRNLAVGAGLFQLLKRVSDSEASAVAAALEQNPAIEYAEPDRLRFPTFVPNDSLWSSQWDMMIPAVEVGGANLPPAWDITTGTAGVNIAVIDTGILTLHPDLAGRFIGGYDFIDDFVIANDGSPAQPATCLSTHPLDPLAQPPCINSRDSDASDPGDWVTSADSVGTTFDGWLLGCPVDNSSFHGTHVSGTIAAASNNGAGVAGINWIGQVVPLRALGKCGGYTSDITDAIVWAVNGAVSGAPTNPNPAKVLNMSFGGSGSCLVSEQAAINTALAAGAVPAVAAGNSNDDAANYSPSSCAGVITVAASQRQGYRAEYSNFGSTIEITAPGGGARFPNTASDPIFSTLNSATLASPPGTGQSPNPAGYDYVGYEGTSMATPHVAGIASLLLSVNPSLTPGQVLAKIQATARSFPTGGPTCAGTPPDPNSANWFSCQCTTSICGAGLIDAGRAVLAAVGATSSTAVVSALNPSIVGTSVALTATVNGLVPTGTVSFLDGANVIAGCTAVTLASTGDSGTSGCLATSLAAGAHSITAAYSGDSNNKPSTSGVLVQTVKAATTTTLASSQNPSTVGANVTFTATVTGNAPTGSVNFTDGGTTITGCGAATLAGATATCISAALTQGAHSIVASYGGDAGNTASASGVLTQTVNVGAAIAVTLASTDFTGDHKTDIVFDNGAGSHVLFTMNGTSIQSSAPLPGAAAGWVLAGIGDFNGDGKADLLWRNTADPTQFWIYLMNGTSLIGNGPLHVAAGYLPTQIGDFDGDGKDDILWEKPGSSPWIFFMNGTTFASAHTAPPAAPGWVIAGVGDFNGDGKADLLWRNTADPTQFWIYLLNAFTVTGGGPVNVAAGYLPTQIGDFNGDGKDDILWEKSGSGSWIYFMNGAGIAGAQPAPGAAAGWGVARVGDFNGDGKADLLWQNSASPSQFWIYFLNGASVTGGGPLSGTPGYQPLAH